MASCSPTRAPLNLHYNHGMIYFLPIGSIHERSVEQEVIDIAVNNKSVFKNVSVVVKRFSVTDNTTLFDKGKTLVGTRVCKNVRREVITTPFKFIILLHQKFLQSDWLRAVVFQLNLKYLHVKITNLLRVVV